MPLLATATRNSLADNLDDIAAGGATGPRIIWAGSNGSGLAEFQCSDPGFGSASGGTIALAGVPLSTTADYTGTVTRYRVEDSTGVTCWAGTAGGAGEFTINNPSLAQGQTCRILTYYVTVPAGS